MNIKNNIKLWSSLGMRATFGLIAMELAKQHPDLMITTSDVSTSAGLDRYKNKYPDNMHTLTNSISKITIFLKSIDNMILHDDYNMSDIDSSDGPPS